MAEKYFLLSEIEKDFDWLKSRGSEDIQFRELIERLENGVIPAADVAPVVRCKDCLWRGREECAMFYRCDCGEQHTWETDDDFCSYGERKEPDNEQSNRNQ